MKLPTFNITKTNAVKSVIGVVVSVGVSKVIASIIETNVDSTTTKDKIAVAAAKFAITGIVVIACKKYTNQLVDDTINAVATLTATVEEAIELSEI
jgi:hypothetical protein